MKRISIFFFTVSVAVSFDGLSMIEGMVDVAIHGTRLRSSIFDAAGFRKKLDEVDLYLRKGGDPNARRDSDQVTPLIQAAYYGNESIVRRLLKTQINLDCQDEEGCSALIYASKGRADEDHSEYENIVRMLCAARADLNLRDKYQWTALMYAAWKGRENIVKMLCEAGAGLDFQDKDGATALIIVTRDFKIQNDPRCQNIAQILRNAGANPNICDRHGLTASSYENKNHDRAQKIPHQKNAIEKRNSYLFTIVSFMLFVLCLRMINDGVNSAIR